MNKDSFVLDTSALLTLMEDEPGAERVQEIILQKTGFVPWSVLMEVYYITEREHGLDEADRRYALLKQSPVCILWDVDESLLLSAAHLKAHYRISFADAITAGYALRNGATLVHKDPELGELSARLSLENLPYK